jgi:hypothetical protein
MAEKETVMVVLASDMMADADGGSLVFHHRLLKIWKIWRIQELLVIWSIKS